MSLNHTTAATADCKKAMAEAEANELDNSKCPETEKMLAPAQIKEVQGTKGGKFDESSFEVQLTDETTCGIWCCKGTFLQKFANKKAYVFLYGVLGCVFSATYSYFNGTITTVEKRFKIPSRTMGVITVGNDISQIFVSVALSYYAGRGHRPRWMAIGLFTVVLFCLMNALPHFLYGPGKDALSLTSEFGGVFDKNATLEVVERERKKSLCRLDDSTECETEDGNYAPQIIFFLAQLIAGVGGSLYYTLGVSYMDDNIKKSKTPALISLSYSLRMLGPCLGYTLASICLKMYVSPSLTPTINTTDPRWLGAWWLGWIILGFILLFFATLLALFPKTLPRAAMRKAIAQHKLKTQISLTTSEAAEIEPELPTSFKDMMVTFKRLMCNVTLMLNNFAAIFYFFGYLPYFTFMPKYIETQYRQSASVASLITGTVSLVFSAFGILISGLLISKFKPRARYLAGWNVFIGAVSVMGIVSYAYLGCAENDNKAPVLPNGELQTKFACNENCGCDYVKYSPVCAQDGKTMFISACHAGCKEQEVVNGSKVFQECSCVNPSASAAMVMERLIGVADNVTDSLPPLSAPTLFNEGYAIPGSCHVDCLNKFYVFLAVVCILKFSGATGRTSNFLVTVRCVAEKDKPVAMAFGLMLMSLCAFVPSPIVFGIILDKACLVWGKTCAGNGNCWLYNGETLRYTMNFTAAFFVAIGTLFDAGVWYYVKDLKIFDEEVELKLEE